MVVKFFLVILFISKSWPLVPIKWLLCTKVSNCELEVPTWLFHFFPKTASLFYFSLFVNKAYHRSPGPLGLESASKSLNPLFCPLSALLPPVNDQVLLKFLFPVSTVCSSSPQLPTPTLFSCSFHSFKYHGSLQFGLPDLHFLAQIHPLTPLPD